MKCHAGVPARNLRLQAAFSLLLAVTPAVAASAARSQGHITASGCKVTQSGSDLMVNVDLILDSLHLDNNRQLYITPVITDGAGNSSALPAVLVNGRNMHYALERHVIKATDGNHQEVAQIVRRTNGKPQSVSYQAKVPFERWMLSRTAEVAFPIDTCGCGTPLGRGLLPQGESLHLNPAQDMTTAAIMPAVTPLPVTIHEGKARIQFEVDRTELHAEPYRCKSGQLIDNRAELKIIGDSLAYALSDPNVEIAEVRIRGFASPESPYHHNDFLATGRSRALSEYIAESYNLPQEVCAYDAVPENWEEFREMVVNAKDISEAQRSDLLKLIDTPAYGPADYDGKEQVLKSDPRFASLYRSKILPEWFPRLRATKFEIKTRLKPLGDDKLAKVILSAPEKMSLNQMFRVANLYPEGSPEFNEVIRIALSQYPDDPVANLKSAAEELRRANNPGATETEVAEALDNAGRLLQKAGDSAEAENARGILATHLGDFESARRHFEAAKSLPEASRNLRMLP